MDDPVAAVAEKIVEYIRKEDVEGLERNLSMSNGDWRQELRYEFNLDAMLDAIFNCDILIPKLIMCDIQTISAFHYAALRGVDSILERFILHHQIPVDMCVQSGSTALHFACFAGMVDTVQLLVDRFHADVNRKDRYGWSPLHYAAIEGSLPVIEFLVSKGADISSRDKDGTTAVFRAQAYGHVNIVSYFIQSSGDEDLLLVEHSVPDQTDGDEDEQIYATPDAIRHSKAVGNGVKDVDDYEQVARGGHEGGAAEKGVPAGRSKEEVANLIRGELLGVLEGRDDDPYMNPVSGGIRAGGPGGVEGGGGGGGKVPLDIGVNTLTRILKDEFMKFRMDHDVQNRVDGSKPDPSGQLDPDTKGYSLLSDYEDIGKYRRTTEETIEMGTDEEDGVGSPGANAPPLPPRTSLILAEKGGDEKPTKVGRKKSKDKKSKKKTPDRMYYMTMTPAQLARQNPAKAKALIILNRFDHSGTVMEACFQALVRNLGDIDDWKKLSTVLPLRNKPEAVKRCVRNMEATYPADPYRQAMGALQSWRHYFGEAANVEALIAAMGKCGLEDKVPLVESAAEEFTA